MVKELPRDRIYRTIIIGAGGYLIAQGLEIILEDIDDFIGLQLTLDTRGNSVDESIQALSKLLIVLKSLSGLTNEILRIVVRDSVNTSIVVCLSLNVDHTVGCLEADLKLFARHQIELTLLLEGLKVIGALTWLLVDHLTVIIIAELAALHRDPRTDKRSMTLKIEQN